MNDPGSVIFSLPDYVMQYVVRVDKGNRVSLSTTYFWRTRKKLSDKRAKLGIMEAVEEAGGVEHLLSDRESTPGKLSFRSGSEYAYNTSN